MCISEEVSNGLQIKNIKIQQQIAASKYMFRSENELKLQLTAFYKIKVK